MDIFTGSLTTAIIGKATAGTGGFLGGAFLMAFYRPKNIWDASIRASISTASAIIGAAPLLQYFSFDRGDWEFHLAAGTIIGFFAWSLFALLARTIFKIEEEKVDVIDLYKKIKGQGGKMYIYDKESDSYHTAKEVKE